MQFNIEKPKTYKGLSYVLKSSFLQNAIEEAQLDLNVHLVYWTPQKIGSILSADYWSPNENVAYDRYYIRAGVVKSEDRKLAQLLMVDIIIPDLIHRIKLREAEPIDSTRVKKGWFFDATYEQGILRINGSEITHS